MNAKEAARLCMIVSEYCPQQRFTPADEDNHVPGTAAMWATALVDVRFADAVSATTRLARRQPFISVSEIIDEVRTIRAERLAALPEAQRPVPNVDPTDVKRYLAGQRAIVKAIADGDIRTDGNGGFILPNAKWQAAITAGPAGEKREIDYSQVFSEHRASLRARREAEQAEWDAREAERRERERQLAALADMQAAHAKARATKLAKKRRMGKTVKPLGDSGGMMEGTRAVRDAAAS